MEPCARTALTAYFEEPFWVGLWERREAGRYQACRTVFGGEPTDGEVYEYVLRCWSALDFSPALPDEGRADRPVKAKRMRRQVRQDLARSGTGTKAQQALQKQREQNQAARRDRRRADREERRQAQYEQRKAKRREKRRGH